MNTLKVKNDNQTNLTTHEISMEVIITVDGITRTFKGDYDTLHNNSWDATVQDLLDTVKYAK